MQKQRFAQNSVKNYAKSDRTSPKGVSNDAAECYRKIFSNCAKEPSDSGTFDFPKSVISGPISIKLRRVV